MQPASPGIRSERPAWEADRVHEQPGLVTRTPTVGNQSLDDRHRDHQVPESKEIGAT